MAVRCTIGQVLDPCKYISSYLKNSQFYQSYVYFVLFSKMPTENIDISTPEVSRESVVKGGVDSPTSSTGGRKLSTELRARLDALLDALHESAGEGAVHTLLEDICESASATLSSITEMVASLCRDSHRKVAKKTKKKSNSLKTKTSGSVKTKAKVAKTKAKPKKKKPVAE